MKKTKAIRCLSCGVAFKDHAGIQSTCSALHKVKADYAVLAADALNARTALRRLLRVYDGDSLAGSRASNLARAVLEVPFPQSTL